MSKNKKMDFLLIYFCTTLKEIFGQYNFQKEQNSINLNELIKDSLKNNKLKITGLEEVMSSMAQANSDISLSTIKLDDINFGNERNLECLKYLEQLNEALGNINKLVNLNANDNYINMPEHCKIEYNEIIEQIIDLFVKKLFLDGTKFYLNISPEEVNIDFISPNEEQLNNFEQKKENKSYDDELEQYYIKSRKDCVEYGLREEIIVCTKYE